MSDVAIEISDRERLMLFLAAQGEPDYLIAYEIGVSDGSSVSRLFNRLCHKMNAVNRTNAVTRAILTVFTEEELNALMRPAPPRPIGIRTLALTERGYSIAEVAKELKCSPSTIEWAIKRVKVALGADSLEDAIRLARQKNYL